MYKKEFITKVLLKQTINKSISVRYSLCCPRPPGGGCPSQGPGGGGRRIKSPTDCRSSDIPYNPCCPQFHHGKGTWKKYKYIALFVCLPLIIIQSLHVSGHKHSPKGDCRDFEFMRIRTKKFPWGDGNHTLFHNDRVNFLPEDCEPPPLDCD